MIDSLRMTSCHPNFPVKRTDFSLQNIKKITEPGQSSAGIRVKVKVRVSSPSDETFNVISLTESRGIIYGA